MPHRSHGPAWAVVLVAVVAAPRLFGGADAPTLGSEPLTAPLARVPAQPVGGVQAAITWDGTPVGQASSPATAFSIAPGEEATVNFTFTGASPLPVPPNASVVLWFFGIALSNVSIRSTFVAGTGFAQINWSFGSLYDLTEGVYQVDAQLVDADGNRLVDQAFYVDARAPYVIGSAIAGFAALLGAVEVYWIATGIRWRRRQTWYRRR